MSWQPSAPLNALVARARLNRLIRDFFARREVMEVETPLLCSSAATDPHLRSFSVATEHTRHYLQTSPEFCMKRLIAAGCGSIYQLCKAFRHEESGRQHNPEFTLLEWYRPGWKLDQLIDEIEVLVKQAAAAFGTEFPDFPRWTYQQAFEKVLGLNPHLCSESELRDTAKQHINGDFASFDRNTLLDLLMSHLVEPGLPVDGIFLTDFPASQASLAKTEHNADGHCVARRAELYIRGVEIANGYQELTDAAVQEARLKADLQFRTAHQLDELPMPVSLLGALQHGFPECAGVALGVDRLMMVITTASSIDSVLSFDWEQA
ncbi:EF-P lysine aminoacylase GenX [Ketobacter sp. MCCC 1A13808]|uniref:EF-P lysine aminoacylase EpmA n=1 Tax=Ketobacter sp. MCCC 1A13808 TaxID=2602738 RepID=UPI0012EC6F0A|nr:EF-P lysine aminoacylase EpmA [Ketobacter sp. MCCC 1A13808]MVF11641.1 EF-P lysine aminoacylase GenX [Ketobacter sp. MCCC 1A13808]